MPDNSLENRSLPAMPRGLSPAARKVWKAYADELDANGLLTQLDGLGFTMMILMYESAWSNYTEAKESGSYYHNAMGNKIKHPAFSAMIESSKQFLSFAKEFGMTPASRAKLKLETTSIDDYEAFLSSVAEGR